MELKYFTIQQWVESDLLYLRRISSEHNYADAMTKVLGRTKFHHHLDYILGRLQPTYADFSMINPTENQIRNAHGGVSVGNNHIK